MHIHVAELGWNPEKGSMQCLVLYLPEARGPERTGPPSGGWGPGVSLVSERLSPRRNSGAVEKGILSISKDAL